MQLPAKKKAPTKPCLERDSSSTDIDLPTHHQTFDNHPMYPKQSSSTTPVSTRHPGRLPPKPRIKQLVPKQSEESGLASSLKEESPTVHLIQGNDPGDSEQADSNGSNQGNRENPRETEGLFGCCSCCCEATES